MDENDETLADWKQFEMAAETIKKQIEPLVDGLNKTQCEVKFRELCYWFHELHIESHYPEMEN